MVTMDTEEPGGCWWSVLDLYSVSAILLYLVFVESNHDGRRQEYRTLKWTQVLEIFFLGVSGMYIIINKHPVQGFFLLLKLARDNIKLLGIAYLIIASTLYSAIVERRRFIEQPKKIVSLYHDVITPFLSGCLEFIMISIMVAYMITESMTFVSIGISVSLAVLRFFLSAAAMHLQLLTVIYLMAAVFLYILYDPVVNKKMAPILLEVVAVNFVLCYMVVEVLTLSLASVRLGYFLFDFLTFYWPALLGTMLLLVSSFCFYKLVVYFLPEANKKSRINPWLSAFLEVICVGSLFGYYGTVVLTILIELLYLALSLLQPVLVSWKEILILYGFAAIIAFIVGVVAKPQNKLLDGSLQLSEFSSRSLEIVTVVAVFLYYGLVLWVMTGGIIIGVSDFLNAVTLLSLEIWGFFYPFLQFTFTYRTEIFMFYITLAIFSYVGQITAPSVGCKRNLVTERIGMVVICIITAIFAFKVMAPDEIGLLQVAFSWNR